MLIAFQSRDWTLEVFVQRFMSDRIAGWHLFYGDGNPFDRYEGIESCNEGLFELRKLHRNHIDVCGRVNKLVLIQSYSTDYFCWTVHIFRRLHCNKIIKRPTTKSIISGLWLSNDISRRWREILFVML